MLDEQRAVFSRGCSKVRVPAQRRQPGQSAGFIHMVKKNFVVTGGRAPSGLFGGRGCRLLRGVPRILRRRRAIQIACGLRVAGGNVIRREICSGQRHRQGRGNGNR